jgi:uncharacterized glyoxalase superfamily protein PhnB
MAKKKKMTAAKKKPAAKKRTAPKAKKVNPVPAGLGTVTFNLVLKNAGAAISFYERAFGAKVLSRFPAPDGQSVWHAALKIGDSTVFVNDPMGGPETYAPPAGQIWLYGTDVDGRFARAVKAGATQTMPVADQFWGDRMGMLVDPFGQTWTLAQHTKDMTPAQMKQAGEEFAKQMGTPQQAA